MAKECGCDAVKFQKRTIDIVYTKEELLKDREMAEEVLRERKKV